MTWHAPPNDQNIYMYNMYIYIDQTQRRVMVCLLSCKDKPRPRIKTRRVDLAINTETTICSDRVPRSPAAVTASSSSNSEHSSCLHKPTRLVCTCSPTIQTGRQTDKHPFFVWASCGRCPPPTVYLLYFFFSHKAPPLSFSFGALFLLLSTPSLVLPYPTDPSRTPCPLSVSPISFSSSLLYSSLPPLCLPLCLSLTLFLSFSALRAPFPSHTLRLKTSCRTKREEYYQKADKAPGRGSEKRRHIYTQKTE
jgi:hypothetical protein